MNMQAKRDGKIFLFMKMSMQAWGSGRDVFL